MVKTGQDGGALPLKRGFIVNHRRGPAAIIILLCVAAGIAEARQQPAGPAAIHGVHWYPSRPPIQGLDYEMDMRGVARELVL